MKKIVVWTALLLFSAITSFAQNNSNVTLTGRVVESDTKEPALQATIQLLSLPDSTYIKGAATVGRGTFTLTNVKPGNYVLKITYIGFRPSFTPVKIGNNNPTINVGTVSLISDAILLEEAVIVAEAPPVTVKEDTIVYSASAYRTAEGAMLEELVKKLPGVEISEDGKITQNGKEITKIMVDGKEFFTDDPKTAMKNLPANMVENVKTYEKKSDMSRITGIDDGEEETVLDLTVKKGMKQGWIGNIIAGAGNKDRYEAGGMLSQFRDNSSLSIIGSMNNTNNQGFSEFGDAGQGMDGNAGSGITSSKGLGVNFAKDSQKLQIGGNVQYGYSDNDAHRISSTETFRDDGSEFEDSESFSRRKRHDVRVDFRFEWRPDSMTTIIFRPNASYSETKSHSSSISNAYTAEKRLNDKTSHSFSTSNNYSINGRLQIFRKLNSKGRNLYIGGNFGYSESDSDSESNNEYIYYKENGDSIVDPIRTTDRNSDSRNWSVSASYTEPIFKGHFLQLRYEFSHQKRLSQSLVTDLDSILTPGNYVESLSSRVENFYDNHTIDLSLRGVHPKMMYNIGMGVTPQSSESKTTIGPNSNKILPKQNVINISPQVMFRYSFNKQHVLTFRYRGRSSAPNISDLQEVIDITDPSRLQYGNPNLKPSFNHRIMMFYNRYIPESMRSYNFNLMFNTTQNAVANRTTFGDYGTRIYHKVNVNGNWDGSGFFSFNTPLKNKKYTLSSNTNIRLSDAVSYTTVNVPKKVENVNEEGENNARENNNTVESVLSTTHSLRLGERLTGNYRSDKFDISLSASINYNRASNSLQKASNRETFDYIFSGNTNITLPWRMYLSTDVNYRIMDGYSGDFKKNEVIWNAQISKNIFKKSNGTIRVKIYDILKQQSNLSRTISETMISDTQYNTLGSYFMVHFVYRLNTLGGKAASRSNFRGPGGERRYGSPGGGPGGGGRRF